MGGCGRTAVAVRRLCDHILSVNVFCWFDLWIGKAVEVTLFYCAEWLVTIDNKGLMFAIPLSISHSRM